MKRTEIEALLDNSAKALQTCLGRIDSCMVLSNHMLLDNSDGARDPHVPFTSLLTIVRELIAVVQDIKDDTTVVHITLAGKGVAPSYGLCEGAVFASIVLSHLHCTIVTLTDLVKHAPLVNANIVSNCSLTVSVNTINQLLDCSRSAIRSAAQTTDTMQLLMPEFWNGR